jgi:SAM-dependent methyltransferase
VLDAGSGTGRIGAFLSVAGHEVVGVDGDPVLVAEAQEQHPDARWIVGDLAELDLPAAGIPEPFDAIVCAGNVMTFLAPSTRREVLARLRAHVAADGRAAIGFGAGRGYEFADFLDDARAVGWEPDLLLSTWDLRPFTDDSDFLVAILRPA